MCPMEKDYSNPYKRATASYLCNTIVRQCFKGYLLWLGLGYGNGTVLLNDPLKLGVLKSISITNSVSIILFF